MVRIKKTGRLDLAVTESRVGARRCYLTNVAADKQSRGANAEWGAIVGALIGTSVGGVIGSNRQTENWERVAVTAPKVSIRIAPSGKGGLMVSATF